MLALERASKTYRVGLFGGQELPAVREVSFEIGAGEVVSLIGESGSGKSTIGRMILRLVAASAGRITVDGVDVARLEGPALRGYYRRVQGVFQDPFSSCNPMYKVDHLFGLLRGVYFRDLDESAWCERLAVSLAAVNLQPGQVLHKYPHQLSGGQLQRLLIARALTLEPRYLVADEVISMLDASTRIDVLNLLGDLAARGLGMLFITHDLSLGHYISRRAVILRRGRVVEMGQTAKVFGDPRHPYTRQLLASVPSLHHRWGRGSGAAALGTAAAAGSAERCLYHETYPSGAASDPTRPHLVEVEADHLVGCIRGDPEVPCR
jgi:peptide/nickel transport system ATP-binding protein